MIKLHKKFKKALFYDKINYNYAKHDGTNMMSKFKAPSYSYENPLPYYQIGVSLSSSLKHFSLKLFSTMNRMSYDDSKDFLESSKFKFNYLSVKMYGKFAVNEGRA